MEHADALDPAAAEMRLVLGQHVDVHAAFASTLPRQPIFTLRVRLSSYEAGLQAASRRELCQELGRCPRMRHEGQVGAVDFPQSRLILERSGADVCFKDPGFAVDLIVRCDVSVLVRIYLGHARWEDEVGRSLSVDGDPRLARQLPVWLQLDKLIGRDYLPLKRPAA